MNIIGEEIEWSDGDICENLLQHSGYGDLVFDMSNRALGFSTQYEQYFELSFEPKDFQTHHPKSWI